MLRFIACFCLLAIGGCGVLSAIPARFTLINESGQTIQSLTIEVDDGAVHEPFHFANIPPGGSVSGRYYFTQEATHGIRGCFADGKTFSDFCGYVVWEDIAPHTRIVLGSDGMTHTQR